MTASRLISLTLLPLLLPTAALAQTPLTASAPAPLNTSAATDSGNETALRLVSGSDGVLIAVWRSNDDLGGTIGTDRDILMARSADHGATWSTPTPLNTDAATDLQHDYRPRIATDGHGVWITVWDASGTIGEWPGAIEEDADVMVARSLDDGVTWSDRVYLNEDAETDYMDVDFDGMEADWSPQLVTDGDGLWIATWSYSYYDGSIITRGAAHITTSHDNGATWAETARGNEPDNTPTPIRSADGTWRMLWIGYDWDLEYHRAISYADQRVYSTYSADGDAWQNESLYSIAGSGSLSGSPLYGYIGSCSGATDGQGTWLAFWQQKPSPEVGETGTNWDIWGTMTTDDGETWTEPAPWLSNAASDTGDDEAPQIIHTGDDTWLLVWESTDSLGGTIGDDTDILFARLTPTDCNNNGIPDTDDLAAETSEDCNENGIPDECDIDSGTSDDCNENGIPDECDIETGVSEDCNENDIPDECDYEKGILTDEDENGVADQCDPCATIALIALATLLYGTITTRRTK